VSRPAGNGQRFGWALSATWGGFGFGYQLAVISGALLFLRKDLGLSNLEQGLLVSTMPLGAMVGGIAAGRIAESLGRRRTLIVDGLLLTAGTALTVVAPGLALLLIGRAIVGLGVGVASSVVPLYLSEIASPERRGRLVTFNQLMVTVGIVVAYCVDLAFSGSGSWRGMFAVGLLPGVALVAGMLRAPESPAWTDARTRAGAPREEPGLRQLLGPAARPALVIGLTLAAAQQWSGINAIVSYAPHIMERTGLSASNSIFASVAVGVVNVAATVVSIRLVDRRGRRPLLLASYAAMLGALTLLGLTFLLNLGSAESWLSLAGLLIYIAAFAAGVGPTFWVLIAEIFPPQARTAGAGIATAANWFWTVTVSLAFLPLSAALGQGTTFLVFAAVCAAALVFVDRYVPETTGRSFTEITAEVQARWRRAGSGRVHSPFGVHPRG
jgi:SP family galactose:H+ symporter-like MFS transporter